jgi:hypothetical protein
MVCERWSANAALVAAGACADIREYRAELGISSVQYPYLLVTRCTAREKFHGVAGVHAKIALYFEACEEITP